MTGVVTSNPPQDQLMKPDEPEVKTEENISIAPSATPAASRGTEQPRPGATVCQNCLTTTTPLWRRDENGQILCNACGLFFKLHGRRRPISLKTDVIKSRNRSRNTSLSRRPPTKRARNSPRAEEEKQRSASTDRFGSAQTQAQTSTPAQAAAKPSAQASPVPAQASTPASSAVQDLKSILGHQVPLAARPSSSGAASHSVQPSTSSNVNSPRIQPSPMTFATFDQPTPARTPTTSFPLPSMASARSPESSATLGPPNIQLMRGSMSELLLPRSPPEGLERVPPLNHISASDFHEQQRLPTLRGSSANTPKSTEELNKELSTRVSELELVNDLLKRRITDLEFSENQARRTALDAQQTAENLWKQVTILKESQKPS